MIYESKPCSICDGIVNAQINYNRVVFNEDAEEVTRGWFENRMRDCQERNMCMPLIRLRGLAIERSGQAKKD